MQVVTGGLDGVVLLAPSFVKRSGHTALYTYELARFSQVDAAAEPSGTTKRLLVSHSQKTIEVAERKRESRVPMEISVNRVAWNASAQASPWLAFGGNSCMVCCKFVASRANILRS